MERVMNLGIIGDLLEILSAIREHVLIQFKKFESPCGPAKLINNNFSGSLVKTTHGIKASVLLNRWSAYAKCDHFNLSVATGKLLKKLHPLFIKFCFWENRSPSSLLNPPLPRQSSQNKNSVAHGHSFLILIGSKI